MIVRLSAPPLAQASSARTASLRGGRRPLSLKASGSRVYLRQLALAQGAFRDRLARKIPGASVQRGYSVTFNGFAVAAPAASLDELEALPGVAAVYPSVRYKPSRSAASAAVIGATALWGPRLETAGDGIKIGIIDDGIDHRHVFFSPGGYSMPPGFPKGNTRYTNAKVIVARAFPPRGARWKYAGLPLDPQQSGHGTHVAGIAAGNHETNGPGRQELSGVAPRAYLGNYKALTVPTASGLGLNGNSPELVAAIEAAVRDGMHVINLSLGEPEVEPSRDAVAEAIDGAVAAGVVAVVAAGNDFADFGAGSVASPGTAARAITVGAVNTAREGAPRLAEFSSAGPTPLSLRLKPELAAPGVNILSALPRGRWVAYDGTSMAAPHVAGGAALLRQRHPDWTPAQVKAAMVAAATPVSAPGGITAVTRGGAGLLNLGRADVPLVAAIPAAVSFGFLRSGERKTRTIELQDLGVAAGTWSVSLDRAKAPSGAGLTAPVSATVPGRLELAATAESRASPSEHTGFVVLTRGAERRRIPYWFSVSPAAPASRARRSLPGPGIYRGTTTGRRALIDSYRFPSNPELIGIPRVLRGPEQVFRLRLRRSVRNFGLAIVGRGRGSRVQPRVVAAGPESRLTGQAGLPLNLNPYTVRFQEPTPIAGALFPVPGVYDIVFDSATRAGAGSFTFRFWIDDRAPPTLRLLTRAVAAGASIRISARDRGAGIDPRSVEVLVDGRAQPASYISSAQEIRVRATVSSGRHTLVVRASDHQEAKNMENVPRVLPNTATLRTAIAVR